MPAGLFDRPRTYLSVAVVSGVLLVAACGGAPRPMPGAGAAEAGAPAAPSRGVAPPETPRARPVASQPGRDCLATLAGLHAAAAGPGLPGATTDPLPPPPVAVLLREPDHAGIRTGEGAAGLRLDADLPLEVHRPDDHGGDAAVAAPCLLVVAAPERPARTERVVLDRERVPSAYAVRVTRAANPDYDAAKARARRAEKELGKVGVPRLISSGDPVLDLVGALVGGVIGALEARSADREYEEAVAALKRTPREAERADYRDYTFERATVRATKRAAVPVTLLDRDRNLAWDARLGLSNGREFRVLEGLRAGDRNLAEHRAGGHAERDLEAWARRPIRVRLSTLVGRFLAAKPAPRPADDPGPPPEAAGGDGAIGAGPDVATARAPAPADPRLRGVVRVVARGRAGSGFYATPDMVLTGERVVGAANVVDVTLPDGMTVPGLVARRDPRRGLALVQVPKPGPPLALDRGAPPLAPGTPVEAAGHPNGHAAATARAAVAAVRRRPGADGAGSGDVLLVETDAAPAPGYAGGPLLRGGRVVGVNGAAGPGGGGLAVHHEEVRAFLAEAGLAPP